ncbi:MAG TPA: lysophospholipid acyltransferase family protein [Candidatus Acidoferrales bacterium]|nr:lysophospholipid acyltransferase family protein [Candidatus Acidoferrales bacterium]
MGSIHAWIIAERYKHLRLYYTPMEGTSKIPASERAANTHFDVSLPQYSRWRRIQIPVIAASVYGVLRVVSPTLRFEVLGCQHVERAWTARRSCIWAFWHCAIFGVLWRFRNRGIVVLNSTNFDGQWMRRVLDRLGYGTAQGSSTRGGLRGLAVLAQRLAEGKDAAFTIDGPRGPRFVAKPGPAMLARRSGSPIGLFHMSYERSTTFESTWDHFQLPRPYSRVVAVFAPLMEVPPDTSREALEQKNEEIQRQLERIRNFADSWFSLSKQEQQRQREIWNA